MSIKRIALQGGPCSFSHEAAEQLRLRWKLPRIHYRFLAGFTQVVDELIQGRADAALLPMENSSIGPIPGIREITAQARLEPSAKLRMPIRHCLVGLPQARVEGLKTVHSHPAALAQCQGFLARHPHIQAIEHEDTANSLSLIRACGQGSVGAIASSKAARFHGLPLLRKDIQDHRDNHTLFQLFLLA